MLNKVKHLANKCDSTLIRRIFRRPQADSK
jgi:hypothetical protein